MRRRILWFASSAPVALAATWLLLAYGMLLTPRLALANRDIPLFHLPLRASLRALATHGLPVWNPWLNGGQPVLSNPSYSAFYPPLWLVMPLSPAYALNLLVVLHGALAFGGAWRLARRLGAGRGAAALAAIGYSGGGAMLSLVSALTLFCGMAWLPWLLFWADSALRAPAWREWVRPALLAALTLALQLLNGEPVTVVMGALSLAALALSAAWRKGAGAVLRLLPALLLALALAAAQLLPAAHRLASSPRSHGLSFERVTAWSAPPERAVELVLPRFFGDPARVGEGLFFGGRLHDRGYPYVISIYPGLLLTLLGLSALAAWRVPRRGAWALIAILGAGLALGRHNPLYAPLLAAVPLLGKLRYPEKFVVMTAAALAFAGALGWQRLLEARQAGRRRAADLPLALALALLAVAAGLTVLLYAEPAAGARFILGHSAPPPGPELLARGLRALRGEGWAAVTSAAAAAGLFALYRSPRVTARTLSLLAAALLATDLLHYGQGLLVLVPAEVYASPPPAARRLLPAPAGQADSDSPGWAVAQLAGPLPDRRVFVELGPPVDGGEVPLAAAGGDPQLALLSTQLGQLEPYSGVLWGLPYALNLDYDLLLTPWAARALEILAAERALRPDLLGPYLGAWNVGVVARAQSPAQWADGLARDPRALPVTMALNPFCLPRYRFVPRVSFHPAFGTALAAARAQRYALGAEEHCWRPWASPARAEYPGRPRLLQLADHGGRIEIRYRAPGPAFLTAANTFDPGWRALLDGAPLPVYPTAVCQLGVELPAGEHRLLLAYGDDLVRYGCWISLAAFIFWAAALAAVRPGRRSDGL